MRTTNPLFECEYCAYDDCEYVTDHPSGFCLDHRHLRPVEDNLDHPGGDGLDDDCDGYWDSNEPEVELVGARW